MVPRGSKVFPYIADPFSEGDKNNTDRSVSLKVLYEFSLNLSMHPHLRSTVKSKEILST